MQSFEFLRYHLHVLLNMKTTLVKRFEKYWYLGAAQYAQKFPIVELQISADREKFQAIFLEHNSSIMIPLTWICSLAGL